VFLPKQRNDNIGRREAVGIWFYYRNVINDIMNYYSYATLLKNSRYNWELFDEVEHSVFVATFISR